jgi:hypothetical protein
MDEEMDTWKHGNMAHGNMKTWKSGNLETRKHGVMETWRHRNMETQKHGPTVTRRHGNMETRIHRHMEFHGGKDTETWTWKREHGDMYIDKRTLRHGHAIDKDMDMEIETWT